MEFRSKFDKVWVQSGVPDFRGKSKLTKGMISFSLKLDSLDWSLMKHWQLQEAKNRLSEVIDKALSEGAQIVTRRGKETAVILSIEDFRRLSRPSGSLVDFFSQSPLKDVDLDLTRNMDSGRKIKL